MSPVVPAAGSAAGTDAPADDAVREAATLIAREVRTLAERLHRWRRVQWVEPANGRSRREIIRELVVLLADADQAAEGIEPATRREVSAPAYDAAWSDRLQVLGRDLAAALPTGSSSVTYAGRELSRQQLAGAVLAQVATNVALLENRAPAEDAAQLALRLLDHPATPPYGEVVRRLGETGLEQFLAEEPVKPPAR